MIGKTAIMVCAALLLCLMMASPGAGQAVPSAVTYQGKLTTAAGAPVPDGSYTVQFKLYTVPTGGVEFCSTV
jgi:hypothetical protein